MPVDPLATRRFIEALSTHLEDHLAAWKSSLADTRREVDTILTAAGERIPAQARSLFPEAIVSMLLEDALPPPERVVETVVEKIVERVEVPVPSVSSNWSLVRSSLSAIESARTQVDVLSRFLTEANAHASRVALLVLRNDRITGWKAIGFDASGGHDEAVKGIDLPADQDPFAAAVLKRERTMLAAAPDEASPLRRALGGTAPQRMLLVPMVIRDRIAGLLVGDELPGEDRRLDPAALEVLTFATGLAVDLLAARKRIPSPTLTPTGDEPPVFVFPVVDDPGATVQAFPFAVAAPSPVPAVPPEPPSPPPPPPPPPPPVVAAAPPSQPPPAPGSPTAPSFEGTDSAIRRRLRISDPNEALRALEFSTASRKKAEAPPAPPVGDLTRAFESLRSSPTPPPPAPLPSPLPPPRPAWDSRSPGLTVSPPPRDSSAPRPVPVVDPVSAPIGGGTVEPPAGFVPRMRTAREDDPSRAVDDAKRLARLLVSEIKLYNEKRVEEGRQNLDIYHRLKDDIERSRQVYNERTPALIRQGTDFFTDELVRILAEGRPEALGRQH